MLQTSLVSLSIRPVASPSSVFTAILYTVG